MPCFTFNSSELKRSFSMAKVIKPETGDFCLRFDESKLIIYSSDKRRYCKVYVSPREVIDVPVGYKSDDFFLLADRIALFDSDLKSISITVNDKSLSITASSDDQSRKAVLKKRAVSSRRPSVPSPIIGYTCRLDSSNFIELLRQVSCSAQIKETKSDEARRVNQVHFYKDHECASSSARYYASVAFFPGMQLDISLVSDDLPYIKSFCSFCGDEVDVGYDNSKIYAVDCSSGSILSLSRININKPVFSKLDSDKFQTVLKVNKTKLFECLKWSVLAIEGTQRLHMDVHDNIMNLSSGSQELSKLPIQMTLGSSFIADFPVKFLAGVIGYMDDGDLILSFNHQIHPTILEVRHSNNNAIVSYHYLQSMVERKQ